MRYLVLLQALLMLPLCCMAQGDLHLSFMTGALFNQLNFHGESSRPEPSGNAGPEFDLRIWKEYNRHWQIGIAAETGLADSRVTHNYRVYQNGVLVEEFPITLDAKIFSPMVGVNIFGHYKLLMKRNWYMYGGAALGVLNGISRPALNTQQNITSFYGGINFGISIPVTEHTRFAINNNVRGTTVKPRVAEQVVSVNADGTEVRYTPLKYSVEMFSVLISIEMMF